MQETKTNRIKIAIMFVILMVVGYFLVNNFMGSGNQVATPLNSNLGQEKALENWQTKENFFPKGVTSNILSISLVYKEDPISFSVESISEYQSFKIKKDKAVSSEDDFKIALLDSSGKTLVEKGVPNTWSGNFENFDIEGNVSATEFSLPVATTTVDFNSIPSAKKIKISDKKGKVILEQEIANVTKEEIVEDFSGINGWQFNNPALDKEESMSATAILAAKGGNSGGGGGGNSGGGSGGGGGGSSGSGDQSYDIVIISDSYTSSQMGLFHQDRDVAINALLSTQPMKARSSQINFYSIDNTRSLKCNANSGLAFYCDATTVTRIVNSAGVPKDVILVLSNGADGSTIAGGGGGGLAVVRVDHSPIWYSKFAGSVVHEIGHASFNLIDEYQRVASSTANNSISQNCYKGVVPPYPNAWENLVGQSEYVLGCYAGNWTAPGGSAMRTTNTLRYNTPSQAIISNILDNIAGAFVDSTNPVVSITSPQNNSSSQGDVTLMISASDNSDIARVKIFVDGVYKYTAHYPGPYNATITLPNGTHSVYAEAVDINGNTSISNTVNITKLADTTPPVIFGVVSSFPVGVMTGQIGFKIYWYTDESATGYVSYGTSPGVYTQNSNTVSSSSTNYGTVNLSGLINNVRYYYVVKATDQFGNMTISPEYSEVARPLN